MAWVARLVALVVCGWALAIAALALGALGGRVSATLDILTHFVPIYLALAVATGLLSLALTPPARLIAGGASILAVVACLILMAPELLARWSQPRSPAQEGDFRIVQFNAWGVGNRTPERAIDWLLRQNADVIVLQEGGRVAEAIARRGGYHMSCGNCFAIILSKAAPTWSNTPANWRLPSPLVSAVTFDEPYGPVTVMGVHRHWPNRVKVYQSEMDGLRQQAAAFPKSLLIVAGDFNSTPWSFARRREDLTLGLTRRTRAIFSWPAERGGHNRLPAIAPLLPIDQVYAGPGWNTVDVERSPRLGSDHYAVMVTLRRIGP